MVFVPSVGFSSIIVNGGFSVSRGMRLWETDLPNLLIFDDAFVWTLANCVRSILANWASWGSSRHMICGFWSFWWTLWPWNDASALAEHHTWILPFFACTACPCISSSGQLTLSEELGQSSTSANYSRFPEGPQVFRSVTSGSFEASVVFNDLVLDPRSRWIVLL